MKVGIVYDGGIRDNGTPYYARVALAKILNADPEWWSEATPIERKDCTHLIHVDDGRDDLSVADIPHPWGYWAIDSHLGPSVRIEKARYADVVWCAQKPFVEVLAQAGIRAKWLPLACEPLHHPTNEERAELNDGNLNPKVWDLAFVGFMQPPSISDRVDFLDRMFSGFPNSWYAHGYFHEEMAAIYHSARIGLNHAVRDDLNMRFFELASIGVPQLAWGRMVGLTDLGFEANKHYIPYYGFDHAEVQAVSWLQDPTRLAAVASNALSLVRSAHTYEHRVRQMIADLGGI